MQDYNYSVKCFNTQLSFTCDDSKFVMNINCNPQHTSTTNVIDNIHNISIMYDLKSLCCENTTVKIYSGYYSYNNKNDNSNCIYNYDNYDISNNSNNSNNIITLNNIISVNNGKNVTLYAHKTNYNIYIESYTIEFDDNTEPLYIEFANSHNGYYSHMIKFEHLDENNNCIYSHRTML